MKLANIEFHYFSKNMCSLSQTDAISLMQKWFDIQMFATPIKERKPNGEILDSFGFSNPSSGVSFQVRSDRFTLQKSYNPTQSNSKASDHLEGEIRDLETLSTRLIENIEELKGELEFHRLATVSQLIIIENYEEILNKLSDISTESIPWVSGELKEHSFRTCQEQKVGDGEIVNTIVSSNTAMVDANTPNGSFFSSPCFTIEIDVNTIHENDKPRFNSKKVSEFHGLLNNIAIETSALSARYFTV